MQTTRFGRPKFGGSQAKLITLSVAAGATLAAAAGAIVAAFVHEDSPWLAFAVYSLCLCLLLSPLAGFLWWTAPPSAGRRPTQKIRSNPIGIRRLPKTPCTPFSSP